MQDEGATSTLVLAKPAAEITIISRGLGLGLDKICFFFFLFCFSFMLDKSTYFAFLIHPFCSLFHPFCFPNIPCLHTVIKVQSKIRESNEQGCIAT